MFKPKMVLFDFGGTLCTGHFNLVRGMEALRLAAENPDCVTTEKMCQMWTDLSAALAERVRDVETPLDGMLRGMLTRCGLRYRFGIEQCGILFDRADSEGRRPMPYISELLDMLHQNGIRAAVISNNTMSGIQLKDAIDRQLPGNHMEFIFSSADFLMCKPAPDMFEAAAKFADIDVSECWYCGDSVEADVAGSMGAGMYAVHYRTGAEVSFEEKLFNGSPYAVVSDWRVLAERVASLCGQQASCFGCDK